MAFDFQGRRIWHFGAIMALFGPGGAVGAGDRVDIAVDSKGSTASINEDFIGFGYETAAVARPGYFSAKNTELVQLYRTLSPKGLVRIGGNISDHTRYVPDGTPVVAPQSGTTVINASGLADLGGFLRATGWKLMWGLNLGTGSEAEAAREAVAVSAATGDRLHSFEIGNEVDLHPRFKGNFAAYHAAYLAYKAAIRAALPTALFSGPDITSASAWAADFAEAESADMRLLTQHYYRTAARRPEATIGVLLGRDPPWENRLQFLQDIAQARGLSYRINEVNSFSGGGKKGVSDTFASALWCLDYMFLLATNRCAGVNLETDVNQFSWVSHYSPIFRDQTGKLCARPCYYGMLAFAMAGKGRLLRLTMEKSDINLTAYATRHADGVLWLAVVNKDLARDAQVEAVAPDGCPLAEIFRLRAPSAESRDSVTLAGAQVSADGKWTPELPEQLAVAHGAADFSLPRASAAMVRWRN